LSGTEAGLFGQFTKMLMMCGPWAFQSIAVAAEFDLANRIGDEPMSVSRLADLTGTHELTLYRFCRALAVLGVLAEHPGKSVSLTPMGKLLQTREARGFVGLVAPDSFRAWADAAYTLRTGKPAFDKVFGQSFYAHLGTDPVARRRFSEAMGGVPPAVTDWCDFSRSQLIVDVGGGTGSFVGQGLLRNGQATGILLDLPTAVADAAAILGGLGVAERCSIMPGDFLQDVPAGGDTYLLSLILCDWADEDCLRILGNIADAMAPGGRIIVVERLAPPPGSTSPGVMFDLHMLVLLGGRNRTRPELAALLQQAGFTIARDKVLGDESGDWAIPIPVLIEAVRSEP
jgi:hypothetical protein